MWEYKTNFTSILPVSCVASFPFINSLPWPYGIVDCPHFSISTKVVGHPGTSQILFSNTMNSDIPNSAHILL